MTSRGSTYELAPEAASVAHARALLRELRLQQEISDYAELLVSELVTNAIRYGTPPIRMSLARDHDAAVFVQVYDAANSMPAVREPTPDVPNGRGLRLVDQLATSWGIEAEETGKTVWFRIDHHHGADHHSDRATRARHDHIHHY